MVNSEAPIHYTAKFSELMSGFFRIRGDGRIFFTGFEGCVGIAYPVLEDGLISKEGSALNPLKLIEVVRPEDLGISGTKRET